MQMSGPNAPGPLFAALRPEGPEDVAAPPSPPSAPNPLARAWAGIRAEAELGAPPAPTDTPAGAPARPKDGPELDAELRRLFGFESFRPGQREVVEAVLGGRDALAVLPTGGGKSLTYLLPGLLLPGVTVVVSPLIALMQDQAAKLRERGLPATVINSQVPWKEQRARLDRLRTGRVELLFVAPERFRNARFMQALDGTRVDLLAVDEAHCVSQWGHDFRPDYLRLDEAARVCGRPPILAVTATATAQVREDIALQLDLRPDRLDLVAGFDRPNLHLAGRVLAGGRQTKVRALHAVLRRAPAGTDGARPQGLVYCATRKSCDAVARSLRGAGHGRVGVYHAGLRDERRKRVQERFFAGSLDVVVATNAFGLGIDKQDIRFVVHFELPGSVEAYYQEAGRAGRDGAPATCALLFAPQDIHLQRFFIRTSHPEAAVVRAVARARKRVGSDPERIERELSDPVNGRAVESALRLLDAAGGRPEDVDFDAVRARAAHEEELLQAAIRYAYGRGCRRRAILDYFGAPLPDGDGCDACDACRPDADGGAAEAAPPAPRRRARASDGGAKERARGGKKGGSRDAKKGARGARAGGSGRSSGSGAKADARAKQRSRAAGGADGTRGASGDADDARRPDPDAVDGGLLEALRALRKKIAKRKRVAAYKVLHDRTLEALAAERPRSRQALLQIHGLGERKVAQYGDQLLEVIAVGGEPRS